MSEFGNNFAFAEEADLAEFDFRVPDDVRDTSSEPMTTIRTPPHSTIKSNNNEADAEFDADNDVDNVLGLDILSTDANGNIAAPKRKIVRNMTEEHLHQPRGLKHLRASIPKIKKRMCHKDEYKNLTSFLSFYQMWGHSVFPKANFGDFITMCGRIGMSSSRVRVMRQEWINAEIEKVERENIPGVSTEDIHQQAHSTEDSGRRDHDSGDDQLQKSRQKRNNRLFINDEDDELSEDDLFNLHPDVDTTQRLEPELVDPVGPESPSGNLAGESALNPNSVIARHLTPPSENGNSALSNNCKETAKTKTTATTSEIISEEDFPPDDYFEDEYAAEMEAMRELEGF